MVLVSPVVLQVAPFVPQIHVLAHPKGINPNLWIVKEHCFHNDAHIIQQAYAVPEDALLLLTHGYHTRHALWSRNSI